MLRSVKRLGLALALIACGSVRPSPPVRGHNDGAAPVADALVASGFAVPPAQHDRWSAPATLPADLGAAVTTLFDQGVADPRGLPYRDVELTVASEYGGDQKVTTHAWVFHSDTLAISWDGLVYPVARVGTERRVRDDVAMIVKLAQHDKRPPTEAGSVDVTKSNAIAVALLARLGDADSALAVWHALQLEPDDPDAGRVEAEDPYRTIARQWIYRLYDRAIAASGRDDRVIAKASLGALEVAIPAVAAEMKRRTLPPAPPSAPIAQRDGSYLITLPLRRTPDLEGLDDLPRLIAEERRRAAARPALDFTALAALPADQRLALLVDHLDEVRLFEQGWSHFTDGSFVPELEKIGEPAIDKLLEVLESDTRLSRGGALGGGNHEEPLGVEVAAHAALESILSHDFFADEGGREQLAATIRTYWNAQRSLSLPERWYQTLADDHAAPHEHVMAALYIAERGAPLRSHAAPTVSDLLAHRIDAAADVHDACFMADAFERWEPAAANPAIVKLMNRAIREAGALDKEGECIGQLGEMRDSNGDPAGIDDYARWVEQTKPDPSAQMTLLFLTMEKFVTRKSVRHAIDTLFAAGSPWIPLIDLTGKRWDFADLVSTPLLAVPSFNKEVLAELADTRIYGTLEMIEPRKFSVRRVAAEGGGLDSVIDATATLVPALGARQPVRVGDWIAYQLRGTAPPFELYWPEAKRDAAIKAIAAWVRRQRRP